MRASVARILAMRDASKFSRFAALMRGKSFPRELVEFPDASIPLNLEIPCIRIVPLEPIAESFQARPIKLLNFAFQYLNFGHAFSLAGVVPDRKASNQLI